jgi:hypothetical protein
MKCKNDSGKDGAGGLSQQEMNGILKLVLSHRVVRGLSLRI